MNSICAARGFHRRSGVATGTATAVWSDYCVTCGTIRVSPIQTAHSVTTGPGLTITDAIASAGWGTA